MRATYVDEMALTKGKIAKLRAREMHDSVNQFYSDGLPYWYHTDLVGMMARKYISLVSAENQADVLQACYLHDVMEDCRKTYKDVFKEFGTRVAELVYAVTNGKGRNRSERAGEEYYVGIRAVKYASFVKLCDRLANVLHGVMHGGEMLEKYKLEMREFLQHLDIEGLEDMVRDLFRLMRDGTFDFTPLDVEAARGSMI